VILLCIPALNGVESVKCRELVRQITLPNATKFIVANGKFDAEGAAKTLNIESGYPSGPAHLQTLSAWAEVDVGTDPRFCDGYHIYALRTLVAKESGFDYAILLRQESGLQDRWTELRTELDNGLFLTFGDQPWASAQPNVIFNVGHADGIRFLKCLSDLFETGIVYGLSPYSLHAALSAAAGGLLLEDLLAAENVTN
jgi:hypothetical protein